MDKPEPPTYPKHLSNKTFRKGGHFYLAQKGDILTLFRGDITILFLQIQDGLFTKPTAIFRIAPSGIYFLGAAC